MYLSFSFFVIMVWINALEAKQVDKYFTLVGSTRGVFSVYSHKR